MRFDDRPTDRQSHSHALQFCREERLEDVVNVFRINALSRVFYRHPYPVRIMNCRFHPQDSRTSRYRIHSFGGIPDQVQDDLLQLAALAKHQRKRAGQLDLDTDSLRLQLLAHKREDILNNNIEFDRRFFLAVFLEHRSNASDYLTSTVTGTDNIAHSRARLVEIGRLVRKPSYARIGIRYHSRQRLADFVGDRRR